MNIVNSREIKELDKQTINKAGIDSLILMERAGVSVIEILKKYLKRLSDKVFTVVCGKGNNGGDGLVVARELLNYTNNVNLVIVEDFSTNESKVNFQIYKNLGGKYVKYSEECVNTVKEIILNSDVVIDAIFGVGLSKNIEGNYYSLIELINKFSKFVVAIDIPSGISADTGKELNIAIRANLTVTFEFPKVGNFLFPGREFTGNLEVVKIGFPKYVIDNFRFDKFLITPELIKLPERISNSNKGTYGKVIVIGGTEEYYGAPLLSSLGAMRAGAGKVIMFGSKNIVRNAVNFEPGIIGVSFEEEKVFTQKYIEKILSYEDSKTVYILGPGLGRSSKAKNFVEKFIKIVKKPLVLDADGIINISSFKEEIMGKNNLILTPHPGEFSYFLDLPISEVKYNYDLVRKIASEMGIIINLKDSTSIISDGNYVYFNITGNSSLSKGGSGDILSGLIAGFIAQGLPLIESVKTASYVLGKAAELYKPEGINLVSEILNYIPVVINELRKKEEVDGNISGV
ncbi:MAG: NAD(P)H-hydrate dehydratase [Thermosipho sp. (in: Bacteria)]|nr:NAD(P)H-hydrate dehydratase [Thermosipho sp. (in: thermotogales)]